MTRSEATTESLNALPLLDAAYRLWVARYQLDRDEAPAQPQQPAGAISPDAIRKAFQHVIQERQSAPEGKTFARLKAIHPDVNDSELKLAIKRAVKFDSDCVKYFCYQSAHYFDDCKRAVELSRIDNPGFCDDTYKQAEKYLMFAMR
jgi:hypothetical protein